MKKLRLIVAPAEEGLTLAALLGGRGGLAEDACARALAAGGVTVNRRRVDEPRAQLRRGDEVVAFLEARGAGAAPVRPLDEARVLLLDEDVIAVDKPAGLAAQGTPVDAQAGLDAAVGALLAARGERNTFVGLVHRLDRDTSGVTVFGRSPRATSALAAQFREGRVSKRYVALAAGHPAGDFAVDRPLGPDPRRPSRRAVVERGEPAQTRFRVEARGGAGAAAHCRLEALPRTGRTHQIRVHAAWAGHPLLGDRLYGGPAYLADARGGRVDLPRVALHAAGLACAHPRGGRVEIAAPWPADLAGVERSLASLEYGG